MPSVTDPADWILSAAREQPDRLFLKTCTGRELCYGSLRDLSGRYAAALMRRGYKVPKRVFFIDELPRNNMGKVQKNVRRTLYASLYAANPAPPVSGPQ